MELEGRTVFIKHKFVIFSTWLFVLVLVVGGMIFMLSMRQIVKSTKSMELAKLLDTEKIKLEMPIGDKINIVLAMANSPLIERYFENPSDRELEKMAFDEIAGYSKILANSTIFWVNDIDKKFYSGGSYIYMLDPSDEKNYWYNMTLNETKDFNFNINYNPDLNNTNLWINAPVFDKNGKSVGILGTGIDVTSFINAIYKNFKGDAELYLFNGLGEITGAKDVSLVTAKRKIEDEFKDVGAEIIALTKTLKPGETQIISTALGEIGITPIPTFGWYALAIAPDSINDYKTAMTWLFLAMLFTMALILVVFNIFISKLFKPLRETMEALEIASKAKSDFLAKMSHEIRTPMNAVMGMAELALREKMPVAAQEHISTIKQAGANLLSIINDILDFSKIESGKLEIVRANYQFSSLVSDVASIIKTKLIDSPVKFVVDIDSKMPNALFGDEVRIRQILLNVLSNAVKYTKKGTISFTVKGKIIDEDMLLLTMEVTDTGKGIKQEDMEKLFGDFIQLDSAANKGIEGTGLGLAIAKSLARAMSGDICVKSEYGKGSTFIVTLPQKIRSHEPLAEVNSLKNNAVIGFSAPSARILIVDDIDTNLKVAEGLLLPYKMKVDSVLSGAEAIEAVKTNRYDLIFMDHMMPEMDGIEATKEIRKFNHLPIIALTANAVSGTREMFLASGFNDFLSKPIDTIKLNSILEKWLPKEKQEAPKQELENNTNQMQILAVFHREGAKKIEEIKKSLEDGDYSLYTTHVHGLKSATANVGANDLSELAKSLEIAGKNKDYDFIKLQTGNLLAALQAYLNEIGKVLQAHNETQQNKPVDFEVMKSTLIKLKEALNAWDLGAIDKATKALQEFEQIPEVEGILRFVFIGEYEKAAEAAEHFSQASKSVSVS